MDSVTQAFLGASVGAAVLGNKIGSKGAILGAIVATIPDLDVLFYLFYDSLDMLSIHRGFSHSILFSVIGGFLIAFLLVKIKWTRTVSYSRLWLFVWLTLFTHILLDASTAYGTQLLLPFSDKRLGLDCINVVDPIYTIPLIVGLALSILYSGKETSRFKFNDWGLIISSLYLITTLFIKQQVNGNFQEELDKQNINFNSLLTMPVGIASLKWYAAAKTEDSLYIGNLSLVKNQDIAFVSFPVNEFLLDEIEPEIANKMKWFAKGFYTVEKNGNHIRIFNLQVDMRGIVEKEGRKSPTVGYFEVLNDNGKDVLISGSLKK